MDYPVDNAQREGAATDNTPTVSTSGRATSPNGSQVVSAPGMATTPSSAQVISVPKKTTPNTPLTAGV